MLVLRQLMSIIFTERLVSSVGSACHTKHLFFAKEEVNVANEDSFEMISDLLIQPISHKMESCC